MLVLSRHRDESIHIDLRKLIPVVAASPETLVKILAQPLTITVVDIRGDKVRLGVEANRSIAVHREEIYNEINRQLAEISATEADKRGQA